MGEALGEAVHTLSMATAALEHTLLDTVLRLALLPQGTSTQHTH